MAEPAPDDGPLINGGGPSREAGVSSKFSHAVADDAYPAPIENCLTVDSIQSYRPYIHVEFLVNIHECREWVPQKAAIICAPRSGRMK